MQLDVMLCDHGQVAGDKLFINGGGVNRILVGDNAGPFPVTFSVAGTASVMPREAVADHVLAFRLAQGDGQPAALAGDAEGRTVGGELHLNGSSAEATNVQAISFAFTFQGVPLATLGTYAVICTLDGVEVRWLWFDVERA